MPDVPTPNLINNCARALDTLADKLDRSASVERKSEHLFTHARRFAAQAMRTLLAAADARALACPPWGALIDRNDEGSLLLVWKLFACSWLRAVRPDFFATDAGMRDFPPIKHDAQGRILG